MDNIEQKAKELVEMFQSNSAYAELRKTDACKQATKCVDEIIQETKKQAQDFMDDFRLLYWQQVKEKIKSLEINKTL